MNKGWLAALALTAMTLAPSVGMAQSVSARIDLGGHNGRGWRDESRVAFDRGYEDGRRSGWNDARHNDRFDFRRDRDYRKADKGYDRSFGSRSAYASAYRSGYEQGYRRAFSYARSQYDRDHRWVGKENDWSWDRDDRYRDRDDRNDRNDRRY
jgi:hypothetical protein